MDKITRWIVYMFLQEFKTLLRSKEKTEILLLMSATFLGKVVWFLFAENFLLRTQKIHRTYFIYELLHSLAPKYGLNFYID